MSILTLAELKQEPHWQSDCYVENNLTLYDNLAPWQHLKSIIILESKREIKDKVSRETHFY